MRHFIPVIGFSLLGASAEPLAANSPVCDVAVETALCLHNAEKILMPDARPYGMEVHLTFDETRPLDTSGKKNHGSGEVMAAAGIGGAGSSALFRNNYVYIPSSESFLSADFSYTFFVYLLQDAKSRSINALHDQFCPIMHKGTMREDVQEASPALLVNPRSNSRLRPHQWYHVGVVRHQNRMRLYVDGILDSSLTTEGSTKTNDLPLFVGGAPYAENVCDTPMLLDEFRMFSYAVGRDHIQAEASVALGGIEPSYLHIGCTNCKKSVDGSPYPYVEVLEEKYEQELKRQQELLSQVQDEKKDATHRCDRLADEIRELERKFSAKAAELHKQYGRELERQRKAFLSGEKARREAWERDRAQEIKEITIKGLEPEIQRLLEKHRGERRSLEEKLRKLSIDRCSLTCQRLPSGHIHVLPSVRRKAREEERLRCKEVATKLSEEIERMRQNHMAEIRQAAAATKEKEEEMLKAMEAAKATAVQEAVAAARKEVEAECHRKLDHLIERLSREQLDVQARFEQQCNEAVAASQASADQLRQQFLEERQKLEADLKTAHEKQLALERQISRLETEAELKEKMRAELQMALDEVSGRAQQQQQQLESQREMLDSLTAQLSEAKSEIEGMRKEEAERLEKLETKVKGTLFAKDQIIQRLKDELSASNTKADHLRGLMNKHRTELMQTAASSCDSFSIDSLPSTAASLLSPADKSVSEVGLKSNVLEQQQREQPPKSKYSRLQTVGRAQLELKTLRKKLQR
ncbi:hypothetical protein Emag_001601 [Eimeria magna]